MRPARCGPGVPPPGRRVAQVGIAAHIARLRAVAGHEDGWGVLGGAVDVGESPTAAAVREAREEISADVQLLRLAGVLGGPDFEVSYPNGDRTAYVTAVYEAGSSQVPRHPVMASSASSPGSRPDSYPACS